MLPKIYSLIPIPWPKNDNRDQCSQINGLDRDLFYSCNKRGGLTIAIYFQRSGGNSVPSPLLSWAALPTLQYISASYRMWKAIDFKIKNQLITSYICNILVGYLTGMLCLKPQVAVWSGCLVIESFCNSSLFSSAQALLVICCLTWSTSVLAGTGGRERVASSASSCCLRRMASERLCIDSLFSSLEPQPSPSHSLYLDGDTSSDAIDAIECRFPTLCFNNLAEWNDWEILSRHFQLCLKVQCTVQNLILNDYNYSSD